MGRAGWHHCLVWLWHSFSVSYWFICRPSFVPCGSSELETDYSTDRGPSVWVSVHTVKHFGWVIQKHLQHGSPRTKPTHSNYMTTISFSLHHACTPLFRIESNSRIHTAPLRTPVRIAGVEDALLSNWSGKTLCPNIVFKINKKIKTWLNNDFNNLFIYHYYYFNII